VVSNYIHNAVIEGAGKMGVIVALESTGKTDELANSADSLMHVAAAIRRRLIRPARSPARQAREGVLADKYRQQGQGRDVIEKIVESGLRPSTRKSSVEQAFIHEAASRSPRRQGS